VARWLEQIPSSDTEEKTWDLVGAICETGDFIGKDRSLALKENDLLAFI
jgi:diaminopimelate decarboxylase